MTLNLRLTPPHRRDKHLACPPYIMFIIMCVSKREKEEKHYDCFTHVQAGGLIDGAESAHCCVVLMKVQAWWVYHHDSS